MPGHLTDERWIDVIEGSATSAESAHLESCAACRQALGELREGIAAVRSAEVPEPSPLYWQALRRNVDERIAGDGTKALLPGWWPALAGLAALALIAAVYLAPPRQDRSPVSVATLPAWTALPPAAEDAGLAILQGLEAGEEDLTGVGGSGVTGMVSELSEAESEALLRELRSGLSGRSS